MKANKTFKSSQQSFLISNSNQNLTAERSASFVENFLVVQLSFSTHWQHTTKKN